MGHSAVDRVHPQDPTFFNGPNSNPPTRFIRYQGWSMSGAGAAVCCPQSCSCINNNLATASSQATTSDCMIHSSKPLSSDHGWEKDNLYSTISVPKDSSLEKYPSEQEAAVDTSLLRSRALITFYQPPHNTEHGTSPPWATAFSTFFQDSSKEQDTSCIPLEAPSPSFHKSQLKNLQNFRHTLRLPPGLFSFLDTPSLWLALYFALNLALTLYNKSVLIHFPFPYTLTALHALCGTIGASILLHAQGNTTSSTTVNATPPKYSWSLFRKITPDLTPGELVVLLLFSMLYTINIVVSNASLRLVTVPFHQVVRASTPFFTIVFSLILLSKRCSKRKLFTLIPVVAGVCFATYGDYYFTPIGFLLTLLGTLLAALKTILTNIILVKQPTSPLPFSSDPSNHLPSDESTPNQSAPSPSFFSRLISIVTCGFYNSSSTTPATDGTKPPIKTPSTSFTLPKLSLSPLHLLYLLSPLAFIQTTLLAHFTGELSRVQLLLFQSPSSLHSEGGSFHFRMWLASNGILAFFLNVVSFNANRRVGPLAMSVASNVKQVLTVLCAVIIFDLTITPTNGLGILLTLIGGALYAAVEYREKQNTRKRFR